MVSGDMSDCLSQQYNRIRYGVSTESYFGLDNYIGSLASFSQLCSVLCVGNLGQAFKLIRALFEKSTDGKDRNVMMPEVKTGDAVVNFLSCIPGVKGRAKVIKGELGLNCLEDLLSIGMDDLLSVDGVGETTAKNILGWCKL